MTFTVAQLKLASCTKGTVCFARHILELACRTCFTITGGCGVAKEPDLTFDARRVTRDGALVLAHRARITCALSGMIGKVTSFTVLTGCTAAFDAKIFAGVTQVTRCQFGSDLKPSSFTENTGRRTAFVGLVLSRIANVTE